MEKDSTKLWRLTRALNDEGHSDQRITLEQDGKMLTRKLAANAFAEAFAQESNTTIPRQKNKEVRREKRE